MLAIERTDNYVCPMVKYTMWTGLCRRMGEVIGKVVLYAVALSWAAGPAYGQPTAVGASDILMLEDSLARLGYIMYNEPSEPERLDANFTFVKTLVSALKAPQSFTYPFDSLDMVSILDAPDHRFRIFSWHLPLNDGSYLYYGAIQMNTSDGSLKLYPLLDKTYEIGAPEETVTAPDNWYGAQYYRIVGLDGAYVLLGWKGYTPYVTQKVIEVLEFSNDDVRLGKPVFDDGAGERSVRAIYRYSKNASMYLDYDASESRIILDHLAPADPRQEGEYEQYGPDLTYDAWQLQGGRLELVPDVPMVNPADANDALFNDPTKPRNHPKSGINIQ